MSSNRTIIAIASILLGACSAPSGPTAFIASHLRASASVDDGDCSFSQGVTTCVTTAQHQEVGSHVEISGCLYGPTGIPGRRSRTFSDTYLVTETTTTLYHGRSDNAFRSQTDTSRQLIGSTLVSDVCEPV